MKRIGLFILKTVLAIMALLLFLICLLYTPAIQRYAKNQTIDYLTETYGLEVHVGELRLRFPLDVSLSEIYCGKSSTDTLLALKGMHLEVGLKQLFHHRLEIREFALENVVCHWHDSSGMRIDALLDTLQILADIDFSVGQSFGHLNIEKLNMQRVDYCMALKNLPELSVALESGKLLRGNVDVHTQTISVDSLNLSGGHLLLQLPDSTFTEEVVVDTAATIPWTIQANAVGLENSVFSMGDTQKQAYTFVLSGIAIQLDSLYNRGSIVKGKLRKLQAVQERGIHFKNMQAVIGLDSSAVWMRGGFLQTTNSRVQMELYADSDVEHMMQQEPLSVRLNGEIGLSDIHFFYPNIPVEVRNKVVEVNTVVSVDEERIQLGQLILNMPNHFKLTGSGSFTDYQKLQHASGNFVIRSEMPDITFVQNILGNSGIRIPKGIDMLARLEAVKGVYTSFVRACQGNGCLMLDATYGVKEEHYDVELVANQFPITHFFAMDSLGLLSSTIRLHGEGIEPKKMDINLYTHVKQLGYRGRDYKNVILQMSGTLKHLSGSIVSQDPLLPLNISLQADSVGQDYKLFLAGEVGRWDLQTLQLMDMPLAIQAGFVLQGEIGGNEKYALSLTLDDLQIWEAGRKQQLGSLGIEGSSALQQTRLKMTSGDFELQFRADTSCLAFIEHCDKVGDLLFTQLNHVNIDMEAVHSELPPFSLRVRGAQDNAIVRLLKSRGIGVEQLELFALSRKHSGIRMGMTAKAPYWNDIQLDSIRLGSWQTGKSLLYSMTAGSSSEEWKGVFNMHLTGRVQGDRFRVELKQQDTEGKIGFDWGINAEIGDTATMLRFFPTTPILGYNRWELNPDNLLIIKSKGNMWAHLDMKSPGKLIRLQSLPDEGEQQKRLQVEMEGIDLTALSCRVPFMPQLNGILSAHLMLYSKMQEMGAAGNIQVIDLGYEQRRLGTMDLGMVYRATDLFTNHSIETELKIDSLRRIWANGTFTTAAGDSKLDVHLQIPSLPLSLANAFIPKELMQLGGELVGQMRVQGDMSNPLLSGGLSFRDGEVDATMLGTVFRMDSTLIAVEDSRISFKDYYLKAPNQSELVLNGTINLFPFDRMNVDVALNARNFELMNVKKNKQSLVYGKAYANVQTRLNGSPTQLDAIGNIRLLNKSNITYVLRSSDLMLEEKNTDFVRFVSFQDTTSVLSEELNPEVNVNNFMMRMLIEIGEQVQFGVELSESGNDRVALQGGGNLIFEINPESGMTLSGKYVLSSGSVVYNVPVVGKKEFSIKNGSFVEWSSNVMNPTLNIVASSQVKAEVEDGDHTRQANLEAMIRIQNSLNRPNITFDLSAPNDMVIQNQLATFSAEERTRQALNLLIYNTYTAPGAAKSGGGSQFANQAIYGFVENELNKYTRKAGLTVGFDSHQTSENINKTDVTYQFSRQLFNERMRVKIGGRVSTDGSEGQEGSSMQDNLVDDISIEYELTKRRNFYIKVFRQANYESVLDGEVIQTGGGLVWRKSFRTLKDLFKSKKREKKTLNERQDEK